MSVVRLAYLVDTDEEAIWIEGAAYATGGWITVEVHPFWQVGPLPAVVTASWDKEADPSRPTESMKSYLPSHIRPI